MEEAGNYMPMCTLPAPYKLFSTFLCNRLCPKLDRVQPEDQVWVQAIIPDAGPLGGIEDRRAQVPGVMCQNVDLDGGFHEGF